MNEYTFDELSIGLKESFTHEVSMSDMTSFQLLSGDENPLHCSDEFSKSRGFPGRVVYGMLTSSLYSTLVGVYLPGKNALLQTINIKMLRPAFIGDMLFVEGSIAEMHESLNIVILKAIIRNQAGKLISKARIQVGFTRSMIG